MVTFACPGYMDKFTGTLSAWSDYCRMLSAWRNYAEDYTFYKVKILW
ncbi:unnamed protein product [marine sediment metagenome]|uniref:Uncharacterized protein n=1 Tax=marine sediment metagenome TaxID=412755 RepID=X0ZKL0_9ZZZZ